MDKAVHPAIGEAKQAALNVLLNNSHGPCEGLPRTAGWGYPEPYTRDLMIAALGFLAAENDRLTDAIRRTLLALARNQTELGHVTSLAHDPNDRGASDTTPLFLLGLAIFREATGEQDFLDESAEKALTWMRYQSPEDMVIVSQLPTSDWRDEQWVMGYGLYVNTIVYAALRKFGRHESADCLRGLMNRLDIRRQRGKQHHHEGLRIPRTPFFAMSAYKHYSNERFDLLGNSLAALTGIASATRTEKMIAWIEAECEQLREEGELAVDLPPCLLPFIQPSDADWRERYAQFNCPGDYHNGGIWPFICGFYIAVCVAAGRMELARRKLAALTELVRPWHEHEVEWGFNEWIKAQTGLPQGRDWQTWSAAMYLYAAACVEQRSTPFFDESQFRA